MYHASTFLSNPFRRLSAALIRPFDSDTAEHLDKVVNDKRKEAITGIKHVTQDLSYRASEFVKATVATAVIAAVAFSVVASSGASLTVIGPTLSAVPGVGVAVHAAGVGVHAVSGAVHTVSAAGHSAVHTVSATKISPTTAKVAISLGIPTSIPVVGGTMMAIWNKREKMRESLNDKSEASASNSVSNIRNSVSNRESFQH